MGVPPALPASSVYTRAYCEENVYCLAREFVKLEPHWHAYAVFISNQSKTVALWAQKASDDATSGFVVVWDYHVILALRRGETNTDEDKEGTGCWIYDQDSRLSMPCSAEEYFARTFLQQDSLEEKWRSWFRVVPAQTFLDYFASDRSHMLRPGNEASGVGVEYIAPPPEYTPIVGIAAREMGVQTNLMSEFVSMEAGSHGIVAKTVEDALNVVAGGSALRSEWAE